MRFIRGFISDRTKEIIKMYESGLSTYQLAKVFPIKQNSVVHLLRNHNIKARILTIPDSFKTKYPIFFIGNLATMKGV